MTLRLSLAALLLVPAVLFGAARSVVPACGKEALGRHLPLAATPLSRTDLSWWRQRLAEKQARLRQGHVGLVWYGDSITQDWELSGPPAWRDFAPVWQRFYGNRDAIDLGFKGDTTAHLLWRIEHGETDGIAPRVAIVLIGANNFGKLHWSTADTLQGIDAIVAALHQRLPQTHLILLGVLPSIRSEWVTQSTRILNKALEGRYASDPLLSFVNVGDAVRSDGQVDPDAFMDPHLVPPDPPLHPTAQAQARIAAMIEPLVARLMGDQPHT